MTKQIEATLTSNRGKVYRQIAALIRDGIHVDTLREKFPADLVNGKAKANAQCRWVCVGCEPINRR